MRVALAALAALAFALAPAAAAQPAVDAPFQPFAFLVGRWEGPAWYTTPQGERRDVHQTETVRPLAGGRLLLIEGEGRDGGPAGEVVYQAVGLLSYDAAAGLVYIDAFNDGRHVRTEAVPQDGGFDWGFEAGGRRVRYAMRLEDGRWHETGYVVLDGGREVPFVEMTLDRVSDVP
jgi:hypothetical protein